MKTIQQIESETIVDRIFDLRANMSGVARSLGISRAALYNKIKRYGIKIDLIRQDIKAEK